MKNLKEFISVFTQMTELVKEQAKVMKEGAEKIEKNSINAYN